MSYRRAIAAATPAICRSSRGRAGRVSHMSRSVPRTSVVFMEASLQRSRVGSIRDVPENPPSFPDVTRARRCHDGDVTTRRPRRPRHWCACAAAASWRAWPAASPTTSACTVLWVRAAFVVLAGVGGAGVLAYGLLWIFVPAGGRRASSGTVAAGASASRRSGSRRWASRVGSRAARAGRLVRRLGRRAARRGRDRRRRRVAGGRRDPAQPVGRGGARTGLSGVVGAAAGGGGRGVRRGRDRGVPARQPATSGRSSSRCSRCWPRWSASR